MKGKTEAAWLSTRIWCFLHPGKPAAVFTPDGTFTVVFTPRDKGSITLEGSDGF